jgi:hypothetical protein
LTAFNDALSCIGERGKWQIHYRFVVRLRAGYLYIHILKDAADLAPKYWKSAILEGEVRGVEDAVRRFLAHGRR